MVFLSRVHRTGKSKFIAFTKWSASLSQFFEEEKWFPPGDLEMVEERSLKDEHEAVFQSVLHQKATKGRFMEKLIKGLDSEPTAATKDGIAIEDYKALKEKGSQLMLMTHLK
jgi:hypothetical protein